MIYLTRAFVYYPSGTPPKGDFRPIQSVKLNGAYTMFVTLKIFDEQQTIELTGKVFAAH